ncbi:MAG: lysophospholipid acyltransferase family protein [Bacteriovorax sp.]|nr:lysophospholipid acyltransferase family protein [Bacteriovorax sp.]
MFINNVISTLIFAFVRLLNLTYRYRYDRNEVMLNLKNKKIILAIWHQNLLAGILAQTGNPHIVIISKSKDADPVARVCKKLGHIMVRGSSRKLGANKGGKLAKDEMIEFLKKGFPGAITVDGPKGPAFKVKPGIIDMAKKANALIIPYAIGLSSFWQFKSWDQFRLPKPFSKILISYGDPIDVCNENITFADFQVLVELKLKLQAEIVNREIFCWKKFSKLNWFR